MASERTTVRRLPEKAVHDVAVRDSILDASRVAHVAVIDPDGSPYVLPVAYARDGERVLIHGSTASRLFRGLAAGDATCLTVTILDALVVARSAFESSMQYRSVMVLGRCAVVDDDEKADALRRITEHLMPGRWNEVRPPLSKELAATLVLSLPLDECSVKVSDSPPDDPESDLDAPIWAGVVPLLRAFGPPVAAPDLRGNPAVPSYVSGWEP
jgi:nitroimidazol reductase NimA-like FMN-containing flavoprotein (pyridoxamine 5'-phosphate oxidase superfamily)